MNFFFLCVHTLPTPWRFQCHWNSVQVATICGSTQDSSSLLSLSLSHAYSVCVCVCVFPDEIVVPYVFYPLCLWSTSTVGLFLPPLHFFLLHFLSVSCFLSLLPCLLSSSSSCSSCSMLLFSFPLAAVLFFSLLFSFFLTFFHSFLLFLYYSFSYSILSIFVVVYFSALLLSLLYS